MESSVGDTRVDSAFRFIIAGASDSSALVAYEELGFVPSTHATSYVHAKDGWAAARKWDNVGYPKSLADLKTAVERFAVPVSGR